MPAAARRDGAATTASADRKIVYYRDPSGAPYWSAEPKKDTNGRDYLPVYEDEEVSFEPSAKKPAAGSRRILYYRNPMGLPDTSPVPKKDWMGMDYIAVYEGEQQDDDKTVKVSLDKIQRSGVRTEKVEPRVVVRPVRAVGTVKHDEAAADHRHHAGGRLHRRTLCEQDRPTRSRRRSIVSVYSPDIVSPKSISASVMPAAASSGCAISAFPKAISAKCSPANRCRWFGPHPPPET